MSIWAALVASATGLIIAFGAYPWQKAKDRRNETLREQRAAVADLVLPIEECKGRIENSISVFCLTIPDLSEKIIEIGKATSLTRVYGASEVADRADDVKNDIRSVISLLEKEKALRPSGYEKKRLPKRPKDYKEAQDKRTVALSQLNRSLDSFFSVCGDVLGFNIKNIAIKENPTENDT